MAVALLLIFAVGACFALGLRARPVAVVAAGTAAAVAALTAFNQLDGDDYPVLDDLVFFALLLGTAALLGVALRRRADLIAELGERADALRVARAEEAAAAVAEERARVAIGVHDALAHRVGEMSLQAAGAARVAAEDPGRALEALARIEATARAALDDIRSVIGVLRRGDAELALSPHRAPEPVPAPWPGGGELASGPPQAGPDRRASRSDAALAVAVFLAIAIDTLTSARLEGAPVLNLAGVALIAAPLAFRRAHPLSVAAAVFAACGLQALLLTPPYVLVTPIVLLLLLPYSVAAHLPLRAAVLGLLVCVAGSLALEPAVPTVLLGLGAWAAGRAVRDRAARAGELAEVTAQLERSRDSHAALARGEERLRIARELHDAVAHSMTVIVLQAGAAQRVWARDPAAARVAVDALTEVARETLAELRVTLRAADPDGGASGLDALDELAARVRGLGVGVELDRDQRLDDLPPGIARVVHAIVKETLTNAARHAAPTSVRVRIAREDGALVVVVADDGRAPGAAPSSPVAGTGTGLRGMRERVAAVGGELTYGAAGAGFRVQARLPLRREAALA